MHVNAVLENASEVNLVESSSLHQELLPVD